MLGYLARKGGMVLAHRDFSTDDRGGFDFFFATGCVNIRCFMVVISSWLIII